MWPFKKRANVKQPAEQQDVKEYGRTAHKAAAPNVKQLAEQRDVNGLMELASQRVPTSAEVVKSKEKNSLLCDMRNAASALSTIGGSQCIDLLMSILNDPSKWQLWNSCVSALGRIGDKRAVDAVVASFRKAQAEWRKTEGMAQLERFHHWEPDMEDHIRALGNLKDARAISVIRQFCDCLKFRTLTNANYRDRIAEVIRVSLAELEGTKESPAEETKRLLDRFVGNVLDGFELQRRIAEIGEAAAPELKRRIQLDGNDSRAAMIAIQRMPPGIACPLVAEGLKCSHRAARSYAVEYMEQHRAECRESAGERAEVEPDAELAARLRLIAHDK